MADAQDPLDEARVDPRDLKPLATNFGSAIREPGEIAPGVCLGQVYWLYGTAPTGRPPVAVMDPPCSGWGTVLVLDQTPTSRRLFHMGSLKSWVIPNHCYEMLSLQDAAVGFSAERTAALVVRLRESYAAHKRRGWLDSDYATTSRVLKALGSEAPTEDEWAALAPVARRSDQNRAVSADSPAAAPKPAGKPPEAASSFKPVKRAGRKGEVLAFFVEHGLSASANEAMAKFGISRSNLLSQLFLLRKDHGIGYSASGDSVSVQLPEGVTDPFAS